MLSKCGHTDIYCLCKAYGEEYIPCICCNIHQESLNNKLFCIDCYPSLTSFQKAILIIKHKINAN